MRETGTPLELKAQADDLEAGVTHEVDFEWRAGSAADNDGTTYQTPDDSCTIEAGRNKCIITFTASRAGVDEVVAWVDDDNSNATADLDSAEPLHSADDDPAEPDDTDVISVQWFVGVVAGATLQCDPETDTGLVSVSRAYTCTVEDEDGNGLAGVRVDAENMAGPNDPDDSDATEANTTNRTPDFNNMCGSSSDPQATDANGRCTLVLRAEENQAGTAQLCFWADEDYTFKNDYEPLGIEERDGGRCDEEKPDEVDFRGSDELLTDVVLKTWTKPAPRDPDITAGKCAGLDYGQRKPKATGGYIIAGSPQADVINGTAGVDTICALGGADLVRAAGGSDLVLGGPGRDEVIAGDGSDTVTGGDGNDRITGGAHADVIDGASGDDVLGGGLGYDELVGSAGRDHLTGGDRADSLRGGLGADVLQGNAGRDSLAGGPGWDRLFGGRGYDACAGGTRRDLSCEA